MGRAFPGPELGGDSPPCGPGKQPPEGSTWVAVSTDKSEGFSLGRNAHGPHLLQPSEHLLSGPAEGGCAREWVLLCLPPTTSLLWRFYLCSLCSVWLGSEWGKGSRFTPVCTGWFLQPHPDIKARGLWRGCLYLGAFGVWKLGVGSLSFLWASQVWLAFHLFLYY